MPLSNGLTDRDARFEDIDQITQVAIEGFPYDPQWNYRYPLRHVYPLDHYRYVRLAFVEYWERTQQGANRMRVVESPDDDDPRRIRVIAFSIWDNPGSDTAVPPVKNHFDRADGNEARMLAWQGMTMEARQRVFVDRYGSRQMSLRMMVNHPNYWRRSAGRKMMEWGIKLAKAKKVAIVMFSSPMGKNLYLQYGFKELDKVRVQVEGEDESVDVSCMAWELVTQSDQAPEAVFKIHQGCFQFQAEKVCALPQMDVQAKTIKVRWIPHESHRFEMIGLFQCFRELGVEAPPPNDMRLEHDPRFFAEPQSWRDRIRLQLQCVDCSVQIASMSLVSKHAHRYDGELQIYGAGNETTWAQVQAKVRDAPNGSLTLVVILKPWKPGEKMGDLFEVPAAE